MTLLLYSSHDKDLHLKDNFFDKMCEDAGGTGKNFTSADVKMQGELESRIAVVY